MRRDLSSPRGWPEARQVRPSRAQPACHQLQALPGHRGAEQHGRQKAQHRPERTVKGEEEVLGL